MRCTSTWKNGNIIFIKLLSVLYSESTRLIVVSKMESLESLIYIYIYIDDLLNLIGATE